LREASSLAVLFLSVCFDVRLEEICLTLERSLGMGERKKLKKKIGKKKKRERERERERRKTIVNIFFNAQKTKQTNKQTNKKGDKLQPRVDPEMSHEYAVRVRLLSFLLGCVLTPFLSFPSEVFPYAKIQRGDASQHTYT